MTRSARIASYFAAAGSLLLPVGAFVLVTWASAIGAAFMAPATKYFVIFAGICLLLQQVPLWFPSFHGAPEGIDTYTSWFALFGAILVGFIAWIRPYNQWASEIALYCFVFALLDLGMLGVAAAARHRIYHP